MNCPWCNREMVIGLVQSGRPFFFTEHPKTILFFPRSKDKVLSRYNLMSPSCMAYHCTYCEKVVLDYSHKL